MKYWWFNQIATAVAFAMALTVATEARADVVTLTFEGLQNLESINNFYNGGTGSLGSSGGASQNYGISFTSDSLALISAYNGYGGTGNFENNPSGGTIGFFLSGAGDTMNVAAGFDTGFSFYYAAFQDGSVQVYSGLNGTGTLLANLALATQPQNDIDLVADTWTNFGVSFAGTAESVIFTGAANEIGFDNITLGSAVATSGTPEPASLALFGIGIAGLAGYGWRRRKMAAK
jgi:PEP-CTERM motif